MAEQLPIRFEFWGNQTFADFFPANNQEILAHLKQTVNATGQPFIFLWGEPGHGKTHLLHACCEEAYNLGVSCFYLDLASHLLTPDCLNDLENIELVCLDNIEKICGDKDYELTLFNFFNRHREVGHRLIITANCLVNSLPIELLDLKTRLNWGLCLKLQPLNDDDKVGLLTHKGRQLGFEINPQTARFLLTHYDRRLSSLWLALDRLELASLAAKRKLTVPFLKKVLSL